MKKHFKITNEILIYRETIRHIWNYNFVNLTYKKKLYSFSLFEEIEKNLFEAIVILPLNLEYDIKDFRSKPLDFLNVKVKENLSECDIYIEKVSNDKNCYWKKERYFRSEKKENFKFHMFFDWNQYDFIDLGFAKVWIDSYELKNNFQNKWGLFNVNQIDFYILK